MLTFDDYLGILTTIRRYLAGVVCRSGCVMLCYVEPCVMLCGALCYVMWSPVLCYVDALCGSVLYGCIVWLLCGCVVWLCRVAMFFHCVV